MRPSDATARLIRVGVALQVVSFEYIDDTITLKEAEIAIKKAIAEAQAALQALRREG